MNLSTFKKKLKQIDPRITVDDDPYWANVDAPRGFLFKATGTHALALGELSSADYKDALERASHGLEPCTESPCWSCNCND